MGTFHSHLGDLHGITVVVETTDTRVFVGRCYTQNDDGIILLDADVHDDSNSDRSRSEYLDRAFKLGVWKKFDRIEVSAAEIATVKKLGPQ